MGFLRYLNKNLRIKQQFIIYFILTLIISAFLSLISISSFLTIFYDKKCASSNEMFAIKNSNLILNSTFKSQLDNSISHNNLDYWVVLMDNTILYSSTDDNLPEEIYIKHNKYSIKQYNNIDNKNYIYKFTPIIVDNEISGGFIQKYSYNAIAEMSLINNLIEKIGIDLFYFLFFISTSIILIPITVLFLFSWLFSHELDKNFNVLIDISNEIKNGNLNFSIDLSYKNEIGKVLMAFNEMKSGLENSLKTQWLMSEQRKDMILALTHDIKTPITILCGHIELLSTNYEDISAEERNKYINIMLNNANKVRQLITQLNEIWNLERPTLSLNIHPITLGEFISSIKDNIYFLCNEKKINFQLIYPLDNKDCYYFDAFRIEETIYNIISNSLKYTKANDTISLKCFVENNSLLFQISDTGKGFSEETDIIFNKYYKNKEDITYKSSSGLGLYICKLIIEKHNGKIHAYNNDSGGATVEFSLPITRLQ